MDKEALIQEVQKYSFLYDLSDSKYSDMKRKEAAWRQIAFDMGEKEQNCRKAWFNLREAHRRALKKKKARGADAVKRKWIYEDQMSFLLPHYKERTRHETTDNDDLYTDVAETNNDGYDVTQYLSMQNDPLNQRGSDSCSNADSFSSNPRKGTKNNRKVENYSSASSLMIEYLLEKKRKDDADEIEKFFSSMAATVKKLPPMEQATLKIKIFNLVSEVELAVLNRSIKQE